MDEEYYVLDDRVVVDGDKAMIAGLLQRGALKRLSFATVRKAQLIIRVTLWDTGMTAVRVRVQLPVYLVRFLLQVMRVPRVLSRR